MTRGLYTILLADSGLRQSADGTCFFEIFHTATSVSDTSSYAVITGAAEKVYGSCINREGQRSQGGYIRGLGAHTSVCLLVPCRFLPSTISRVFSCTCSVLRMSQIAIPRPPTETKLTI